MGAFDWVGDVANNLLGVEGDVWVKRISRSALDIEICKGEAVADPTTKTCALCVALNKTIFKNSNKPDYYHPNCKCKNVATTLDKVVLDFPMKKITGYLFVKQDKSAAMHSIGYTIEDADEIYNLIAENVSSKFMENQYILKSLNNHGQHIQINFSIAGKESHFGNVYGCHCGAVVWPNGKIKIATPLILDEKENENEMVGWSKSDC